MIMQRNKNKLFNNVFNKKGMLFDIKMYKSWLRKTFIRIIIVSILLITISTIKILNLHGPNQAVDFIQSRLESETSTELYLAQGKKILGYISAFYHKAIEAIKMEDKLNKNFIMPIDGEIVTYFNEKIGQTSDTLKGLLFRSHIGGDIYAIDEGVVIEAGSNKSVGNYIIIKHRGELLSVYKYVSANHVNINDSVSQGQVIGISSDKLLLEIWHRNEPIDPLQYIDTSTQQL